MTSLIVLNGYRTVQLTQDKNTLIDEADWPLVADRSWRANRCWWRNDSWYAVSGTGGKKRPMIGMHRLFCEGKRIDHRDGDGLNNTRENLRPCTPTENARNVRAARGRSRFKGVHRVSSKSLRAVRWRAHIGINGKTVFLGCFATEEEAARMYDKVALEQFGEFAATNADLFGEY